MNFIKKAIYTKDYRILITFDDDSSDEIDFSKLLDGDIYEPLKNLDFFKKFILHPDLETLVWSNGADFSPEFLYQLSKKQNKSAVV